jgi:pimeloyl-ACP methyl ester carboxylesterase
MMGNGPWPVVVVPGADDGLTTVGDAAAKLARRYRHRQEQYRLLILGRRQPIPDHYSVDQHAQDMIWAVKELGWGPAVWECLSVGGPVGQWVAIKGRNLVRGLILTSTCHYAGDASRTVIQSWLDLIAAERWKDMAWSGVAYTVHPSRQWLYRLIKPFTGFFFRPKPYARQRMTRLLQDSLKADTRSILPYITCPALVIGGEDDRIVPAGMQREMAGLLRNARLVICPGVGHASDRGNPAYDREVERFVAEVMAADE